MKKSRFTEEQIIFALKLAELGGLSWYNVWSGSRYRENCTAMASPGMMVLRGPEV